MQRKHRFSLRIKLVLFTVTLALITYVTSGVFIYLIDDYIQSFVHIPENTYIIIVLALGVFWSGVLAFFAARFITKPLQNLEEVATKAANGNLNQTIETSQSHDEIGSLTHAFKMMLDNLKSMIDNVESNVKGTNITIAQIREASQQSSEYATHINETTTDIAHVAEMSAHAIQDTSMSISDVMKLAEGVQQKAAHSREKSTEMVNTLDHTTTAVHELVQGIQQIAADQTESLEDVDDLKRHANQIESILTMVGDIANQTNLLALNASIEAARAGENGRGFAVVADEVRLLADQSGQAVQRISGLITAIQEGVNNVVQKINDNVKSANKEASNGENTNNSIAEMSGVVTEVAGDIDDISNLVDKQLTSIKSTVNQAQEVTASAEETSASSEEVSALIAEQTNAIEVVDQLTLELERHAEVLNRRISQFSV